MKLLIFIFLLFGVDDSYLFYKRYFICDDKYIIFDSNDSLSPIKMFNSKNILIKSINSGNGPGELSSKMYKTIVNDKVNKCIHIWDQTKQVLNTYDYNLDYIDSYIVSGSYKNLAMWIEYKKHLLFIENNSIELYSFESLNSNKKRKDIKYDKNSYFNNLALRQNPIVYHSNNKLYISYRYLNIIHIIDNMTFEEVKIGKEKSFNKHHIDHVKYELPTVGLNPLGVLDICVENNSIYVLYSENTFSRIELFNFLLRGVDEYKQQKIVDDLILITDEKHKKLRLNSKSEYIYRIKKDTVFTTNNGNVILTIIK